MQLDMSDASITEHLVEGFKFVCTLLKLLWCVGAAEIKPELVVCRAARFDS